MKFLGVLLLCLFLGTVRHTDAARSKAPTSRGRCLLSVISRGGSMESGENMVVTKLRNIIRSFMEIGERKVPLVTKVFRTLISGVESITGIELLPDEEEKKSKKKSKGKKRKKKAIIADSDDDDEATNEDDIKEKKTVKLSQRPSAATKKHLASKISASNPNYRVQRELKEFVKAPPPHLAVKVGSNIRIWVVTMVGAENTIYEGEVYKLRVSFPKEYPVVPPSVYFLPSHTPQHEHVYTNGDICLSLLGKDWRPTMTAQSIAVSIHSILSSANTKSIPMDNARHSQNKPGQYQKDWVYHDDNC